MGEQNVKNIAWPVRAYAMSANAVASTALVAPVQSSSSRRRLSLKDAIIAARAVAVLGIGIAAWWTCSKGIRWL